MSQEPHIAAGPIGAEGWFHDPYGRHEARWFSAGEPTPLVKDGDVEGHDEVSEPPTGPLVPIEGPGWTHGQDLARADEAEAVGSSAPDLIRAGDEDPAAKAAVELEVAEAESTPVD